MLRRIKYMKLLLKFTIIGVFIMVGSMLFTGVLLSYQYLLESQFKELLYAISGLFIVCILTSFIFPKFLKKIKISQCKNDETPETPPSDSEISFWTICGCILWLTTFFFWHWSYLILMEFNHFIETHL